MLVDLPFLAGAVTPSQKATRSVRHNSPLVKSGRCWLLVLAHRFLVGKNGVPVVQEQVPRAKMCSDRNVDEHLSMRPGEKRCVWISKQKWLVTNLTPTCQAARLAEGRRNEAEPNLSRKTVLTVMLRTQIGAVVYFRGYLMSGTKSSVGRTRVAVLVSLQPSMEMCALSNPDFCSLIKMLLTGFCFIK